MGGHLSSQICRLFWTSWDRVGNEVIKSHAPSELYTQLKQPLHQILQPLGTLQCQRQWCNMHTVRRGLHEIFQVTSLLDFGSPRKRTKRCSHENVTPNGPRCTCDPVPILTAPYDIFCNVILHNVGTRLNSRNTLRYHVMYSICMFLYLIWHFICRLHQPQIQKSWLTFDSIPYSVLFYPGIFTDIIPYWNSHNMPTGSY